MRDIKVLLIHSLPPKKFRFSGVEEVELLFARHFNFESVFIHNFFVSPSRKIKNYDFDVIVLTSSFLDRISQEKSYRLLQKNYAFLENKKSFKIGLPQDDYWAQFTRDDWYSKNLDLIVSVFDKKYWPILYPKSIKKNIKIIRGHTTYINDKNFMISKKIPFEKRKNDFVYRTSGAPFFPNKYGFLKSSIGERFQKKHKGDFKMDISNNPKNLIFGDNWIKFLSNSKAVLGCNSGSSVILRDHRHINRLIAAKKTLNNKSKQDFEKIFFKKEDRDYELTDISPRNIEAAKTMTLQVLFEGKYGGILKKDKDYFCLKEDFSNSTELISLIKNPSKIRKITQSCYDTLKDDKSINEYIFVENIKKIIDDFLKNTPHTKKKFIKKSLLYKIFDFNFSLKFYLKFYLKKLLYNV